MASSYQDGTASAPGNIASGDYTYEAGNNYVCGNAVQPLALDSSLTGLTSGRYVLVKASSITGYTNGATVSVPAGRTLIGVSRENVNVSGTNKDCIVATLA